MPRSFRLTAWDRLQLLTRRFSDQQVRMVVELDGRLDEDRLAAAVRAAVKVEPVLGCRVLGRSFHLRWVPLPDLDAATILQTVRASDGDDAIVTLCREDLDPWSGPIFRVGLVRGEHDALVVNLDHSAGDAASVRSLTYLLATLYNHPDRIAATDSQAHFARRGFGSLQPSMTSSRSEPGTQPANAEPSWRFPWGGRPTEFRKRLVIRRLAPDKAAAVHRFAACRNAWLNDIFVAAYFRALDCLVGPDTGVPRLTVPIDMRAYLPARERPRIANFSASFEVTLDHGLGGTFDETLDLVRAGTEREKRGRPGLGQAAALSRIVDRVPFWLLRRRFERGGTGLAFPPPWFIALGVIRPENLSFGPVAARHAYSLQSVSRAGGVFQLSASLFAESINLAVCVAGDAANEEVVNRFLDLYEAELAWCSSGCSIV